MVVIHCAYTEQINPSGVSPVLTKKQIWNGLQRKIRKAQDFVPVITGCDVISEKENEVVREAHFKAAMGSHAKTIREICKSYPMTRVDFWQPDGHVITNTISDGPGMTENDYNMTYTFEWDYPDVKEGSDEYTKKENEHREGAKMAVHSSIVAMRKMAEAGELD